MTNTPTKARVLRLRAFALGVTVTELARRAGMSRVHADRVLNESYQSPRALARLEAALAEAEAQLATLKTAA
jgi:transcriptional regulator with XRE-family HTH domain